MTIDVSVLRDEAEQAKRAGGKLYQKLLPTLRLKQLSGQYIAINIVSGAWVVAPSRADLIKAYKKEFGRAPGWVQEISYDDPDHRVD